MTIRKHLKQSAAVLLCSLVMMSGLQPAWQASALEIENSEEPTLIETGFASETDLDDSERVFTTNVVVENGSIESAENYFDGIEFNPEFVDLSLESITPEFDPFTAGDYTAVYKVSVKSGKPEYTVSRIITVLEAAVEEVQPEEPSLPEDSEETDVPETEEKEDVVTEEEPVAEEEKAPSKAPKKEARASYQVIRTKTQYVYTTHFSDADYYSTYLYKVVKDGVQYPAYCTMPSRKGDSITLNGQMATLTNNSLLAKILYYGAEPGDPSKLPAGEKSFFNSNATLKKLTPEQRFIVTHLALGNAEGDGDWNKGVKNSVASTYALQLVAYAQNSNLSGAASSAALLSANGQTAASLSLNATYDAASGKQLTPAITLQASNAQYAKMVLPDHVDLIKVSGEITKNGKNITIFGGAKFKLSAPKNLDLSKLNLKLDLPGHYSTYGFNQFRPSNSTYQNFGFLFETSNTTHYTLGLNVNWENHRVISITKKDQNGNLVAGATLQILDQNMNPYTGTGTNADAYTWVSSTQAKEFDTVQLPAGTYYLSEISAPAGYLKADRPVMFEVKNEQSKDPIQVSIENTKITANIKKVDNQGDPVHGAELAIVDEDGKTVRQWTTTEAHDNGYDVSDLPAGNYVLKELTTPGGYVQAKDIPFIMTANGKLVDENGDPFKDYLARPIESSEEIHMVDRIIKVELLKTSDFFEGANLKGAHLQLLHTDLTPVKDKDGKNIEWISSGTDHFEISKLPAGDYYIREISAPDGHTKIQDTLFSVDEDGTPSIRNIIDSATAISINKISSKTGQPLAGATLQVLDSEKNVVTLLDKKLEFVTDGNAIKIENLPHGNYFLREVNAPDGYMVALDVPFTVNDDYQETIQAVTMTDDPTAVSFLKVDDKTNEPVAGAHFEIHDKDHKIVSIDGKEVAFVSEKEPVVVYGLPAGDYFLHEAKAPEGYTLAEDVAFTVTDEYRAKPLAVVMSDAVTRISIEKISGSDGKALEGAKLAILNENKDPVLDDQNQPLEFVSGAQPYVIEKLPAGNYWLRELEAPAGYATAEDQSFTVTEENEVISVVMVDETTKVSFSKQDITTSEELEGAKLTILDTDGNVVKDKDGNELSWISGKAPHMIEQLPAGNYVLREEFAPEGYLIANDVSFEVKDSGEVQTVVMKDDYTKVDLSKQDITTGKELPGASLEIQDENGNVVKDRNGNELKWVSTNEPHRIDRLPAGNYFMVETSAPAGYLVAEKVAFTVTETGEVLKVVMKDDYTKVDINKVDDSSNPLAGAELMLCSEDGSFKETFISTKEGVRFNRLKPGKYTLSELKAPNGYALAKDITFELKETSDVQSVTMIDKKITKHVSTGITSGWELYAGIGVLAIVVVILVIYLRKKQSKTE